MAYLSIFKTKFRFSILPKDDAQQVTLVFFLNRRGRAMGWVGVRSNPKNQPDGNPVKHSVLGPIYVLMGFAGAQKGDERGVNSARAILG